MTIASFNDLSAAVANWMGRAGVADFTANVPDFIMLAEARINYGSDDSEFPSPALRTRQMEILATTLTILASTNTVLLPADFLEMRRIYLSAAPQAQKLTYLTPNQLDTVAPAQSRAPLTTIPYEFYTLQGNALVVPAPLATAQTIVMGYYQKLPALSQSTTTNWLLQASPGIYLAGAQLEGAIFVRDAGDAELMARVFSAHLRAFQKQDLKGRYSGDALQMKTDTGAP